MKILLRATILLSLAIASSAIGVVSAQSDRQLTDQEVQYLTQSCAVSQRNLQSVQRADLVTRINRVREYQLMLTLMNNFNARAIQNDVDVTDAVLATASVREKMNKFSADFTRYDASVRLATDMNCSEQQFTYIDLVQDVREAREELKTNVAAIEEDFQIFSDEVDEIQSEIEGGEE